MTDVPTVEVCHAHQQFREENGQWLASSGIPATDRFDNADFVESTCPHCSCDDQPVLPFDDLPTRFRKCEGLEAIQHRVYA